jgi:hypothetical protein
MNHSTLHSKNTISLYKLGFSQFQLAISGFPEGMESGMFPGLWNRSNLLSAQLDSHAANSFG